MRDQIELTKRRLTRPVCRLQTTISSSVGPKEIKEYTCQNPDWLFMKNGRAYAVSNILYKHIKFDCSFNPIMNTEEEKVEEAKVNFNEEDVSYKLLHDLNVAKCWVRGEKYVGIFGYPIRDDAKLARLLKKHPNSQKKYNILALSLHGLSLASFVRNFPNSYGYFIKNMKGRFMKGYSVSEGTQTSAFLTLLANTQMKEIPKHANFTGEYIWESIKTAGYVTLFAKHSTVELDKVLKFSKYGKTADHYFDFNTDGLLSDEKACLESKLFETKRLYKLLTDVYNVYEDVPTFSFFHMNSLTTDSMQQLKNSDIELLSTLKLLNRNSLRSTIVFIMSDVGDAAARNHIFLKDKNYEEIQPFLGIALPKKFRDEHRNFYENFKINENYLINGFDIYETFRHISQIGDSMGKTDINGRGISLFKAIPSDRTCESEQIKQEWCPCYTVQ
ncbi:DgyrCDS12991 [Dimorphilus gyrociliatus]|uniref:DgyrCDS12991 n=1 Tax=Dimorphilus gyrociliatus TaxID=2664684 RepID=A0A7I8W9B9_9ANNE|nr:DgyrCDS12991 [Dimorphilus gyrociliatus]